jgi:hypothetical protein
MTSNEGADPAILRPVWDALSSLFLDTEISVLRDWRVRQLAASPFSLAQIEQILVDDVYPICRWNLLLVAGEWAAFDLEWLERSIHRRRASPLRFLRVFDLFNSRVLSWPEWQATKAAIAAARVPQ